MAQSPEVTYKAMIETYTYYMYLYRVTGIEVPEHERNEEDMEDPRDFFSSTGKTLTARSTRTATAKRKSEVTDSSSEDMEIQQSKRVSMDMRTCSM